MGITIGKSKKTQKFSFDLKSFFKWAHISLTYRGGLNECSLCFKFFNFFSKFWRKYRFGFLPLQWSSIVMAKTKSQFSPKNTDKIEKLKTQTTFFYSSSIYEWNMSSFEEIFQVKTKILCFFTFSHCNSHCNYWPLEQLVSVDFFLLFSDFLNHYTQ